MTHLLRTGNFARFCQTTKDRLIHYDRIGLLHPAQILSNGYRLYHPDQFFDLSLISTLQDAGLSLHDIRMLHDRPVEMQVLGLLRTRLSEARRRAENVLAAQSLLEHFIASAEDSLASPRDTPERRRLEGLDLRLFPIRHAAGFVTEDIARQHVECINWDVSQGGPVAPPSGLIVSRKDAVNMRFRPSACFTRIPPCCTWGKALRPASPGNSPEPTLYRLPAREAVLWHGRCSCACLSGVLERFMQALRNEGLELAGDILLFDEMNYVLPYGTTGNPPDEMYELTLQAQVGSED